MWLSLRKVYTLLSDNGCIQNGKHDDIKLNTKCWTKHGTMKFFFFYFTNEKQELGDM